MWKKVLLSVVGLVVVFGVIGGVKASQISALIESGKNFEPPPKSVTTAKVERQTWTPNLKAVGTVIATQGVTVASEVPGLVERLAFESGAEVKTGAVLVRLDSAIERAQLAAAEAKATLTQASLRRAQALSKARVNAEAELDAAQAEAQQARAQVDNLRAQIGKKVIRAPFSGKLGIRQVEVGQILRAGDPIVTLLDLDRVYVDFYLPQKDLGRISEGQPVKVRTDARPGGEWSGQIDTIEPSVDASTRNVRVRALFDNPEGELRPGLFVEVQVVLPSDEPVMVVPATAVVYQPYGNSIFVVEEGSAHKGEEESSKNGKAPDEPSKNGKAPDEPSKNGKNGHEKAKTVKQVFVELGQRRGDFIAVKKGLSDGQEVVSSGGFKLSNGDRVTIHNEDGLDPQLAPNPKDS